MGTDYTARKQAKKFSKKASAEDRKAENGRKERIGRKPRKRLAGVCWGQPVLTPADKQDSDDDVYGDPAAFDVLAGASIGDRGIDRESMRSKRLRATVPLERNAAAVSNTVAEPTEGDLKQRKREARKLRDAEAAAGKVQLSTTVGLLQLNAYGGSAPNAAHDAPQVPTTVVSEAFASEHPVIRQYMARQGFAEATSVQQQCWTAACAGRDIVAQAPTGSGKTLAFLLPMAVRLCDGGHGHHSHPDAPLALCLAPTRELALQTWRATAPLRSLRGLRSACIYGGEAKQLQVQRLSARPHLLVATPGRLLDLHDEGAVSLAAIRMAALDECDKMLGLGFAPQLQRLANLLLHQPSALNESTSAHVQPVQSSGKSIAAKGAKDRCAMGSDGEGASKPGKRRRKDDDMALVPKADAHKLAALQAPQVLMFSATLANDARAKLGAWVSKGALCVNVSEEAAASMSTTVTQVVQVCAEHKKPAKLLKHLHSIHEASKGARALPRVLIFCNKIKTVQFVFAELQKVPYKVTCLHGDCSQQEREAAVTAFKAGKCQIMVATDIAARGLHVKNLPYIVNYDFPSNLDTYIHRAGRTGRLQLYGHVFSFFTRNLACMAPAVATLLQQHGQPVDPNLKLLSDAYTTVASKVGCDTLNVLAGSGDAAEDADGNASGEGAAEEAATLVAEDVCEGLHSEEAEHASDGHLKRKRCASSCCGACEVAYRITQHETRVEPAGASVPVSTLGLLAPEGSERSDFIPARRFAGARSTYVFKLGSRGLGYYLDHMPQVAQRKRSLAKEESALKGAHKKSGKSGKRDDDVAALIAARSGKRGGILGPSKAQLDAMRLAHEDQDSDGEEQAAVKLKGRVRAATGKASRRALPGRLRKKLARDAAGKGAFAS